MDVVIGRRNGHVRMGTTTHDQVAILDAHCQAFRIVRIKVVINLMSVITITIRSDCGIAQYIIGSNLYNEVFF